ncbi:MAG: hypothetical protein A2Y41_01700 [Spirochaetes bacterium GWB1_36_13]|nr:MAG: hypothetical protein A2Y41_01700 [Spirochaetes bacterium GWB1_36_13]
MIVASPKKNGISRFILSILDRQEDSEIIFPYELNIQACTGCEACFAKKNCILNDDMTKVYKKIEAADTITVISPIYFFGFPAPLKALIDRTQVYWHHPLGKKKKGLALMIGEMPNVFFIPYYEKIWKYIFHNWGIENFKLKVFGSTKTKNDIDKTEVKKLNDWLKES